LKTAALGIPVPFSGDNWAGSFRIVGKDPGAGQVWPHGDSRFVTPGYFETMGIKLLRGRVFTMQDRVGTEPVVVIDDRLAQTFWPNEDPIGAKMDLTRGPGKAYTVIGVVSHVRHTDLSEDDKGCYYSSLLQTGPPAAMIVAKGNAGVRAMETALRQAMHDVDPNQPLYDVKTMEDRVSLSLGTQRFAVRILSVFAGFALLMAALGLYGMVSYSVTLRTQEIGVRIALGAGQREVLGLILGQGLRLTLAGVAAGLFGAYAIARVLSAQLHGVGAFDAMTFALTATVLGIVALVASYVPARRALRVDPMVALRYE
jgi:predicted permease